MSAEPNEGLAFGEMRDSVGASIADLDRELGRRPEPLALVIFGGSGDLSRRKLLPALFELDKRGSLPDGFAVIGVSRSGMSDEAFQALCLEAAGDDSVEHYKKTVKSYRYLKGDYADTETFKDLKQLLEEVDRNSATAGNRIYYLATVPALFSDVARGLGSVGANQPGEGGRFARLVVEKPFGSDVESAHQLDNDLHEEFSEDQIFRIDHYMGKETVLNVLALRFANSIFEPIWNRHYIDSVQVTVAESLGIEHRGEFYEKAGALRDIVQNHVMQVLALTLMEPPALMDAGPIRDEKVKLLRSVVIPSSEQQLHHIVRGQYLKGRVEGEEVIGYREEEGVSRDSTTETYVAMDLSVDNWRWAGVPIYVRTGKRLPRRATQVVTIFQRPPHLPFAGKLARDLRPDSLTLRIQPDEGISLSFGAKVPGPTFRVRSVSMDFSYSEAFPGETVDAYERLLLDAMIGDAMLFIRSDEVDQAWSIVQPIQEAFSDDDLPLTHYIAGTWGPVEAERLIERGGRQWRNP